ncbi:hypothetical protein SALBM311S_05887 [Streptomyces alboniger]
MENNLRQLAAYAAVARAKSFTAAAARLHVSQSSRCRRRPGAAVGDPLLERDTRNVQLTVAGVEALRIAEQIVNSHRSGMKELERFLLGESGTVAVAMLLVVLAAVSPPSAIAGFPQAWVAMQIMDGLEQSVLGKVLSGDADFAITTGEPSGQLEHLPLVRDRFVAVLPQDHPLAERPEVFWRIWPASPSLPWCLAVERTPAHRRRLRTDRRAGRTRRRGRERGDSGRAGRRGPGRLRCPPSSCRCSAPDPSCIVLSSARGRPAPGHRPARATRPAGGGPTVPGDPAGLPRPADRPSARGLLDVLTFNSCGNSMD